MLSSTGNKGSDYSTISLGLDYSTTFLYCYTPECCSGLVVSIDCNYSSVVLQAYNLIVLYSDNSTTIGSILDTALNKLNHSHMTE